MNLFAVVLVAQLAAPARQTLPVLAFPEPGLDDSVAYQGYQTRFFRDAAANTVQIYLDARSGRVVHLLANADNESIGFTARDAGGNPVSLQWGGDGAEANVDVSGAGSGSGSGSGLGSGVSMGSGCHSDAIPMSLRTRCIRGTSS
jgi:hypothetical protein